MVQTTYNVGDLVQITYVSEETSFIAWSELPIIGIYMGVLETTRYRPEPEKNEKIECYKVWARGKMRYIANLSELKLLAHADISYLED